MSVNASVQIVVNGIKTKTQVPVVVKTNHVMTVQYPFMMNLKSWLMVKQRNKITDKILNHHVVAIQLRVSMNAILDTWKDFIMMMCTNKDAKYAKDLVSKFAQLSRMPNSFVIVCHHVNHVCLVKEV